MPTWQFFHITTKVGRSSLTFLLPTTTGHPPEPADYSVPTIDHIAGWLAGWLCSMLFHVLPRFYGLVIAKKWAQKLAPSQSLLAAAVLPPTTTVVVIIIHAAFHRWTVEVKRKAVPLLLYYILLFPSAIKWQQCGLWNWGVIKWQHDFFLMLKYCWDSIM